MKLVHFRAPHGNPHPGLPWCKTSNIGSVSEDDIVTANEFRVTCAECKEFLVLLDRVRPAVLAAADESIQMKANEVRANLDHTMEPEVVAPKVDWFGDE